MLTSISFRQSWLFSELSAGRVRRRNVGALKLSNLLQLDRFEEDLNISRVRLTAPRPPSTNGSVIVSSVAASGTAIIGASIVSGQLNLTWPAIFTGLRLQVQTNSAGIGTNWVTIAGTDASDSYSVAVGTNKCVFYRLAQ